MDERIENEVGKDGTRRRFTVVEIWKYKETLCSYGDCSKWFTSPQGRKARFCSAACRRAGWNELRQARNPDSAKSLRQRRSGASEGPSA